MSRTLTRTHAQTQLFLDFFFFLQLLTGRKIGNDFESSESDVRDVLPQSSNKKNVQMDTNETKTQSDDEFDF